MDLNFYMYTSCQCIFIYRGKIFFFHANTHQSVKTQIETISDQSNHDLWTAAWNWKSFLTLTASTHSTQKRNAYKILTMKVEEEEEQNYTIKTRKKEKEKRKLEAYWWNRVRENDE